MMTKLYVSKEYIVVSASGKVVMFNVSDIRVMGMISSGVRVMKLVKGDKIVGIA